MKNMENKEFIEKVALMRKLQKEYFKLRSSLTLWAAKKAEIEVDTMILKLSKNVGNKQGNLFE